MMEHDLRLLRAFVAVAEEGSFTRAAARVGVTQSSLSLQIQRLEASLGIQLFVRTTRSVTITNEGTSILESARVITDRLEIMRLDLRRLRSDKANELHIGTAFFTLDIPERNAVLEEFAVERPDIVVKVHDALQPDLVAAIIHGRIELALVLGTAHSTLQPDHVCPSGHYPVDMRAANLGSRPVGLLIPRESPLSSQAVIEPEMLDGIKVAMIDQSQHAQMHRALAEVFTQAGAKLHYHFESCHALAVERFAARQRMVCVSLGWFQQEKSEGEMCWRPLSRPSCSTDLAVLKGGNISSMGQALLEYIIARNTSCVG